ncbi:MAG TPA: nuclear transport factor 2 family protein [Bryobacteraceae bacterium]|jgi:ketosteroid isomerase-like protein
MTKWILGLLSATMLLAGTPDAKTEKEVLAALDTYKQALINRDAAALSKVLGDDLTYTHSSNKHEDKAAVLESLKGTTHTEAIDFKDTKIRVYGSTAIVTADADFRNNAEGTVALLHLHVIHVFVKNSHGWQMVARQTTRYPEPAAGKK